MVEDFIPPLAVFFVWSSADNQNVEPILESIRNAVSRDTSKPFSRSLNLPLFFFSSYNPIQIPFDSPKSCAKRNLIFVFVSKNTAGRDEWREYVENLPSNERTFLIPVALDSRGLTHGGSLQGINCIRAYGWPSENFDLLAVVFLSHEIFRFGFSLKTRDELGSNSSIKIFLSHAKSGCVGKDHAESIKRFIDNTNMNHFFDTTEISPGLSFGDEIEKHIQNSTMVAIASDVYSSRYWCQREILTAKKLGRPIVVLNCLEDSEDRIFPAISNVPCIHVTADTPITDKHILRLLSATIIETIRHEHVLRSLELYKSIGWIPLDSALLTRPPEIRQVLWEKQRNVTKICYPDPPIYPDEADWHHSLEVETFTPLWRARLKNLFQNLRIGITVSNFSADNYYKTHLHHDHLIRLTQDLSKHLLSRSATLIYGGDLRPDGFTEFILDEALILQERIKSQVPHIENHLSWPLYLSTEQDLISWKSNYHSVMKTVTHPVPEDVTNDLDKEVYLVPNCTESSYIWSRCLTEMRNVTISASDFRISAGGRSSEYKGKMPGVLEEIIIAVELNKPLFLLGGYGGVTNAVCELLLTQRVPEVLTEEWQISHNIGYAELQEFSKVRGYQADYNSIVQTLLSTDVSSLASNVGLSIEEYKTLMRSPFSEECIYLVMQGMENSGLVEQH